MEDYKPNSHASKEQQPVKTEVSTEKKVEKAVAHDVKLKKKSGFEKFADAVIQEDIQNVKSYILMDVLLPAFKKAISDIVSNGIDMILYGETRGRSRNDSASGSRVSYRDYYDSRRSKPERSSSRYGGFEFEPPIFDNRGEAEGVLDSMDELLDRYRVVSIADLYDLCDIPTSNHTYGNYGWTDLRSASIVHVREGFIIKLPRPMPID